MVRVTFTHIICSLAFVFVGFFCLCIFLILRGENRRETPNMLAASIMIGHAFFTLYHFSGVFHMYGLGKVMGKGFCWIFQHLEIMYKLFIPCSLLIFTVERLIFIKDPVGYAQKIKKVGIIVMLGFPWVFSLIVASSTLIGADDVVTGAAYKRYDGNGSYRDTNETRPMCYLDGNRSFFMHHYAMGIMILLSLLVSLVCAITVLVMWCCYKRKLSRGTDYALMGEQIETSVKHSVVAVCNLNVWYLVLFVLLSMFIFMGHTTSLSLYGLIQGIVFISAFRNVRETIAYYCCFCCKKNKKEPEVAYTPGDEAVIA